MRGDEVRLIRERLGLSRAELAEELEVDQSRVWRWEKGHTKIQGPERKLLMLYALGVIRPTSKKS